LNGTYQCLICADVNLLGKNTNTSTIKRNAEAILGTCKEFNLEVNAEKTKLHVHLSSPECR